MADTAAGGSTVGGPAHHREIDWAGAARAPEFKKLVRRRRSFGAEVPLERPAEAPTPPPRTRRREPVAAMSEQRHHRT